MEFGLPSTEPVHLAPLEGVKPSVTSLGRQVGGLFAPPPLCATGSRSRYLYLGHPPVRSAGINVFPVLVTLKFIGR